MHSICRDLHVWANSLPLHKFPVNEHILPLNGLYLLFEKGEVAHGTFRIVRVGTHTGTDQLQSRLRQHFLVENKDRSIFRKNIGRALLNRDQDPFLSDWELDLTTRYAKEQHFTRIDINRQKAIEKQVSDYIQSSFSFVVLSADNKERRLRLESRIISTLSFCEECQPSAGWLGQFSPKLKIRECGLWLVNELYGQPLSAEEFAELQRLIL